MSVGFKVTFLFMFIQCGASLMTHGRAQKVTLQSTQLKDSSLLTDQTQGRVLQHDPLDYFVPKADESSRSEITDFDLFVKDETTRTYTSLTAPPAADFRSHKNIANAFGEGKVEGYNPSGRLWLTRKRREAESVSSISVARLAASLKTMEIENHQLKSTVSVLQEAAEKFSTRLQDFVAQSNFATAQQMTQTSTAHQQQLMALGQLQLQLSQLSTKVLKLEDENEALRTQLRSLKEEGDLRQQQLVEMSNVTTGLQTANNSIYTQLQTLNAARQTQNKMQDPALLEKIEMLQEQTMLLDSHLSELSVLSQGLLAANTSLHLRDAALEERLDSQVADIQQGYKDLMNRISNHSSPSPQPVGFHARLTNSVNASADGTLAVDKIEYSSGGDYNPQTGVFTAPVTGLYLFLANMAADMTGDSAWIAVVLDKTELCRTWSRYSTEIEMASCHAASKVVKGQKVSIAIRGGFKHRRIRGNFWTTFSGVLIQGEE